MGKIWATIDRFEEDKAVLILSDNQQLIIMRADLPPAVKEGDQIELNFSFSPKQTNRKEKKVKNLLKKL